MSSWISSLSIKSDDIQVPCSSNQIRKDFLAADFKDLYPEICTHCGGDNKLRFMFVNEEEAVFKCEGNDCLYPFRDFMFKNFTDNTIYRYKFLQPPDPPSPNNDSVPLEDILNFSPPLGSPGESVDFDLDALLDDGSTCSFSDQIDDIKNWLETDERRSEIKENIERILADGPDTQRPRKLKKCLAFVKKEFAKQKMKMKENTEVNLTKTPQTMGPLDVMNVIRASTYISPRKLKNLKLEKKSVMPIKSTQQQLPTQKDKPTPERKSTQQQLPTQKDKPTLQRKKVIEPKCFREEKISNKNTRNVKKNKEQLIVQTDDKKKKTALVTTVKSEKKPPRSQKDVKSPDPLEGVRRSQRIRTKNYDTIITKSGMKKQYKT